MGTVHRCHHPSLSYTIDGKTETRLIRVTPQVDLDFYWKWWKAVSMHLLKQTSTMLPCLRGVWFVDPRWPRQCDLQDWTRPHCRSLTHTHTHYPAFHFVPVDVDVFINSLWFIDSISCNITPDRGRNLADNIENAWRQSGWCVLASAGTLYCTKWLLPAQ